MLRLALLMLLAFGTGFAGVKVWSAGPSLAPEPKTHTISGDPGGKIISYIAKYVAWNVANDRVIIDGECNSACTIVVGVIDDDKLCATRNAEFGFHSASFGKAYDATWTAALWTFYDGRAERVLKQHGWKGPSNHPEILVIDAQEIVRPCTGRDYRGKQEEK